MAKKSVTYFSKSVALFFDNSGRPSGRKNLGFNYKKTTFKYKDREYFYITETPSQFRFTRWLFSKRFFFYNLDDPMPKTLASDITKIPIPSMTFKKILDNKFIEKLASISTRGSLDFLKNPKVIIALIVIIIIVYFLSTGKSPLEFFSSPGAINKTISSNIQNGR